MSMMITIKREAIGESIDGSSKTVLPGGAVGEYRGHVPIGNVLIEYNGRLLVVPEIATHLR